MENIPQIPKRLFYVWFGNDMPADVHACIQTWKLAMPDYEIIKVGEEKTEWFDFQAVLKDCDWLKAVYERKLWAYVSDYVRIKILHDHGGIYLDTDVTASQSFEPLRKHTMFMGYQCETEVNGAVIGSVKHHPFLRAMLDYYENGSIFKTSRYLLPEIITYILEKDYGMVPFDSRITPKITELKGITIYPEQAFYPFRYRERYTDACITPNTYSVHWWKASWHSEEDIAWLQSGRLTHLDDRNKVGSQEEQANPENLPAEQQTLEHKPEVATISDKKKSSGLKWLYRVKRRSYGKKYIILGIPFFSVRKPRHREYVYLFNTIPIYGK